MPTENETKAKQSGLTRFLLAPLAFAVFSAGISEAILILFATDIAKTFFGEPTTAAIGAVSQLNSVMMGAEILLAITLSFLTIRLSRKPLFLFGSFLIAISAIGSYYAPNLLTLQIFYAIEGAGSVIVNILAVILIAEYSTAEKMPKTISYLYSTGAAGTLVLIPIVGVLTNMGGWRSAFIFLSLPISATSLFLTAIIVRSHPKEITVGQTINPYLKSLKQISKSKSATACLLASLLTFTGGELAVFAFAFYRTRFAASPEITVIIFEIAILLYFLAPLVSGRLICKYGSKRVLTVSTLISACFMAILFVAPNLWVAVTMDMTHVWFGDMAIPAFACLFLEQVPKFQGTMFSLGTLGKYIGKTVATILGGAILIFSPGAFMGVGFSFAAVTILGCAILVFFVKSTTTKSPIHQDHSEILTGAP